MKITVPAGSGGIFTYHFEVLKTFSVISYFFRVDHKDIRYQIVFLGDFGITSQEEMKPILLVSNHLVQC